LSVTIEPMAAPAYRSLWRDPEHGLVTFTSSLTLPANASLDPATGIFTWTPSLNQVGTAVLHFVATDAGGLSDDGEMLVTVSQAGVGPAPPLPCDESAMRTDGVVGMGLDPGDKSVSYVGFDVPANVQRIEGQLSFALAPVRDLDFYLLDADSNAVTSSASTNQPESIVYNTPSLGHYIWKVVAFTNPDTAKFAIDQQVCVASTNAATMGDSTSVSLQTTCTGRVRWEGGSWNSASNTRWSKSVESLPPENPTIHGRGFFSRYSRAISSMMR